MYILSTWEFEILFYESFNSEQQGKIIDAS